MPFAFELTVRKLEALGCAVKLREAEGGSLYVTDNGNYIADCEFGSIADPKRLHDRLNGIPGVVDNGLFIGMAHAVIVGRGDGSIELLS